MTSLHDQFKDITTRWWGRCRDHGGPHPGMIADLVAAATVGDVLRLADPAAWLAAVEARMDADPALRRRAIAHFQSMALTAAAGAPQSPGEPPATQPPAARPARQRSASTARQAAKPATRRTTRKDPA